MLICNKNYVCACVVRFTYECACVTVISYYIQTSDADIPNPETAHSVEYHNLFEQFSGSNNNSYHKYFCGYNNNYCGCCLFN